MMVASEACMVDPASLKMFGVLLSMMLMPVNWRKNMSARAMRKGRRTPRAQKSRGRSERLSCNADEVFFWRNMCPLKYLQINQLQPWDPQNTP